MSKKHRKDAYRYPIGQAHHNAKLTDEQVKRMRTIHASNEGKTGKYDRIGYESLAEMFCCGVSTARDICTCRTRIDA